MLQELYSNALEVIALKLNNLFTRGCKIYGSPHLIYVTHSYFVNAALLLNTYECKNSSYILIRLFSAISRILIILANNHVICAIITWQKNEKLNLNNYFFGGEHV